MRTATMYRRPRLRANTWGLSYRWFAFHFSRVNGFWMQLPFVYLGVDGKHVELSLGRGRVFLSLEARWAWG